MFDRSSRKEVTLEASREVAKPKTMLKPRKVGSPPKNCCYPSKWHLIIIFSKRESTFWLKSQLPPKCAGVLRWKEEKGRNLRRLPRLQQEDSSHSLASSGKAWGQHIIVIDLLSNPNLLLLIYSQAQMFCHWWSGPWKDLAKCSSDALVLGQ